MGDIANITTYLLYSVWPASEQLCAAAGTLGHSAAVEREDDDDHVRAS